MLPGELGQSLQEPGGVAVHRHAAALEASRCSLRSPPLLPGAEPRVAPPNYHQLATTAPATQRQEGGISDPLQPVCGCYTNSNDLRQYSGCLSGFPIRSFIIMYFYGISAEGLDFVKRKTLEI